MSDLVRGAFAAAAVLAARRAVRDVLGARQRQGARARMVPVERGLPVPPAALVGALGDAAVSWSPEVVWAAWLGAAVVSPLVAVLLAGPAFGVVVLVLAAGAPVVGLVSAHGRAARLADAALPDALDAIGRSLRAGASLPHAVREAGTEIEGPVAADLRAVADDIVAGSPLSAALAAWLDRRPRPPVRLAVAALRLADEAGGAAARSIDGVATTLRTNLAVAAEAKALASQARYSAAVIGLAPLVFAVLGAAMGGSADDFLLRTPAGLACLVVGLGLEATGGWWMHRITTAGGR